MTAGLKSLPQNSVNQRPTMALFCSVDMDRPFLVVIACRAHPWAHPADGRRDHPVKTAAGNFRQADDA